MIDAMIVVAGDFNSFDTCFLECDFGLQQIVTTATHGPKIIDKSLLVNLNHLCVVQ